MFANALDGCRPSKLNEFVGNKATIKDLRNAAAHHPFNVLVIGQSGCGKSLMCDLLAEEVADRYEILHVKTRLTDDHKLVRQLIENFVSSKTIESFFSNKAKLIVLDDIDIMLATDKNFASFVGGLLAPDGGSKARTSAKKKPPPALSASVIMTCSTSEERKVADLKKKTTVLRLGNPSYKDAFAYIHQVVDKAGIAYQYADLKELIEAFNCNIRNVVTNLHLLSEQTVVQNVRVQKQLTEATHFDVVRKMFKMDYDIAQLRFISDNTIVPLMLYENYPKELFHNRYKMSDASALDLIETITDRMLDAELQETYMYQRTDWDMYDMTAIIKMGYINTMLKGCKRKKTGTFDSIVFPPILTKLSVKCGFARRLVPAKEELGVYELENVYRVMDEYALSKCPDTCDAVSAVYCNYVQEICGKSKTDVAKIRRKLKSAAIKDDLHPAEPLADAWV